MRAIIIDDKDARALLDKLKLVSLRNHTMIADGAVTSAPKELVEQVHRAFVYVVVGWLNEQGAKLHEPV